MWLATIPIIISTAATAAGPSVVLAGDLLIVFRDSEFQGHGDHLADDAGQQAGRRPSALIAFDKVTGAERWRVSPPFSHDSYMTPLVWSRDGQLEAVIATGKTLAGYVVRNGSLLWKHEYPMQQIVPSLAVSGDTLFITGGHNLPCPIYAVKAPRGEAPAETIWFRRKGEGNLVTPVCWNGLLFTCSHIGVLTCCATDTGAVHWTQRLSRSSLSSLLAGDGKLFAVDEDGTLSIRAADTDGALLTELRLDEHCTATPALANGAVFVRTARHLFCIGDAK